MTLIYCYGVIGEVVKDLKDVIIDNTGFENGDIYFISFKDIFAVVSKVSKKEFSQKAVDENVRDMVWLTKNAPLHETIVTKIMQETTILPMKFCTIFNSEEQLKLMLEDKYGDVKYFLHRVQGKQEMSLNVYTNLSNLKNKLKNESLDIQKLEQEAASKSPGQAYFVKQKIDLLLKNKVRQQILFEKQKIMDKMKELAVEVKKNDVLARKVIGKEVGIEMILNLALLVDKDNITYLNKLVLEKKKELSLYELELSGPFAAYNFIR